MRKKILSLVTIVSFAFPIYAAKISGSRIGATSKSAGFFVEAYSENGRVLFKSIKFDEQGKFEFDFPTHEAMVYWIDNFPVYIQANDEIEIVLPERKNTTFVLGGALDQKAGAASLGKDGSIAISGRSAINHLLINQVNIAWSDFTKEKTGRQTVADMDSKYSEVLKLIKQSKNEDVNSIARFYNDTRYLEVKLQYLKTHAAEKFPQNYFSILTKISLNNRAINGLKPIGVRAFAANYYLFLKLSQGGSLKDEDLTDQSSLNRMQYLLKNVRNERMINEELNQSIVYHLSIKGWSPELDKIMIEALNKITDTEAKKNLTALRETYSKVSKNAQAPDFSIPDATGKLVSLDDFSGKIIAIDVWATWCIPCMHSLPYFLNMREKYKDNPNVVFISVSIDNDTSKSKWLTFLKSKNMNGVDLHAGDRNSSAFEKAYNITGIPRYILIDRGGKIIEDHAVQASEPEYEKLIETALKSK